MSSETPETPEGTGRLDDAAEEQQPSSTTEGAAAEGDYDPAQGSPEGSHPTGEDFPEEAARYDEPRHRRDVGSEE